MPTLESSLLFTRCKFDCMHQRKYWQAGGGRIGVNTISQGYSFLDLLYVMCHAVFAHELIRLCGSMSACA